MDILASGWGYVALLAIHIKIGLILYAKIARSESEEWSTL